LRLRGAGAGLTGRDYRGRAPRRRFAESRFESQPPDSTKRGNVTHCSTTKRLAKSGAPAKGVGASASRRWPRPWSTSASTMAPTARLGGHLEQLVLADPLQALLEVHDARRRQPDAFVGRRGAHVRELFLLGDVHVEVIVARVLADDLALVHELAGIHEHRAAGLEVVDGVAGRAARAIGHEGAVLAVRDLALPLVPAIEDVVQQAGA